MCLFSNTGNLNVVSVGKTDISTGLNSDRLCIVIVTKMYFYGHFHDC